MALKDKLSKRRKNFRNHSESNSTLQKNNKIGPEIMFKRIIFETSYSV